MNFDDIFKSSFLEKTSSFSAIDMIIALSLAFALGLLIYMIYKKTYSGVMYNANFAVSLLAMSCITTLIILAVTSNVVLSLGMVGALSIVRFRSAVKEALDICFIFWSISVGIILGAGLIPLAVFGSIVIALIMVVFLHKRVVDFPYVCIVNAQSSDAEQLAYEHIKTHTKRMVLKAKSIKKENIETTYEVRLKDQNADFMKDLLKMEGIENTVLVSYNGEYMA